MELNDLIFPAPKHDYSDSDVLKIQQELIWIPIYSKGTPDLLDSIKGYPRPIPLAKKEFFVPTASHQRNISTRMKYAFQSVCCYQLACKLSENRRQPQYSQPCG